MAVFWSGTVPVMAALMLGFGKLGSSIQKHVPVAMAIIVVAVGVFTIAMRAPVVVGGEQYVVANPGQLVEQIHNVDQSELPCCSDD